MSKIIYHVTAAVDADIVEEWLTWVHEQHIPDIMRTGCFTGYAFHRLLTFQAPQEDKRNEHTFVVQYYLSDIESFHRYNKDYAPNLRQEVIDKYGSKMSASRMVFEESTLSQSIKTL